MELDTKENGLDRKDMGMEFRYGKMVQSMKVNGKMIKQMVMELSIMQMEMYT